MVFYVFLWLFILYFTNDQFICAVKQYTCELIQLSYTVFEQTCTLPCAKFRFIFKNCFAALLSTSSCLFSCVALYCFMCFLTEMLLLLQSFLQDFSGFSSPSGVQLCPPLNGKRHHGISPSQESACVCARELERVLSDNTSML